VLIAGGESVSVSPVVSENPLATAELYDPTTATFRATGTMTTARRMHTATLLPDNRVLIVGGYGGTDALASAELFDPRTGSFRATGHLLTARGGHTAVLLLTGKVLIVGGYGSHTYPDIAPAELFDPASEAFSAAGVYVGRGGCDFCAPSILLADGTVLFPGQHPTQLYDPATDAFSPSGMMISDESAATALPNGTVLFAGGETDYSGRIPNAEVYDPVRHTFVSTGRMNSGRVWHTLSWLPDRKALAAGGETDSCTGTVCSFAGSVASAEIYDPSTGSFVATGNMTTPRETHTATLLRDGRVLLAGGVVYGGIGFFGGSLASAELYTPEPLVPAPVLVSVSGDGHGQGAIFHAGTTHPAAPEDPAVAGEDHEIDCTGCPADSLIPPQEAIGGRLATVVRVNAVSGVPGIIAVAVRVPSDITPGPAVPVRLTYLDRPSNEVTIAVQE
jgi:hypothetical protein